MPCPFRIHANFIKTEQKSSAFQYSMKPMSIRAIDTCQQLLMEWNMPNPQAKENWIIYQAIIRRCSHLGALQLRNALFA